MVRQPSGERSPGSPSQAALFATLRSLAFAVYELQDCNFGAGGRDYGEAQIAGEAEQGHPPPIPQRRGHRSEGEISNR